MPNPYELRETRYARELAVQYADYWAYRRNPRYDVFDELGGDCTNFVSQALYYANGVMNFTPTYGWYYIDANQKAPAWTGVPYFFDFMTRKKPSPGPVGVETTLEQLEPGDFVQLLFTGDSYGHTPIVVEMGDPPTLENTLVAAH